MAKIDFVFKICIFGDGGVGKTTLTEKYMTGLFLEDIKLTIGTNFYQKHIFIMGKMVGLQIWDFAGERHFRQLFPRYIKGSSGAIFMYDITRNFTLINMKEWMNLVRESVSAENKIPILMVGGKTDLEQKRAVTKEFAEKLGKEYGFLDQMECSAKTGYNVEEIFAKLTVQMMKNNKLI